MENILIMSDIHANLTALNRLLISVDMGQTDGIIILGDIIDYGPCSNEVIKLLDKLPEDKVLVNIWGNHEKAIMEDCYEKFSSDRGENCAKATKNKLSEFSNNYINQMNKNGWQEFELCGKKCLAVHGSLEDVFWKSIDIECRNAQYKRFDYVFWGHSHIPCYVEKFYECHDLEYRNKKRTVFLNPGSVGQPRNHSPFANYAILNIKNGEVRLCSLEYDYKIEMKKFSDDVDKFYKERLVKGV